MNIAQLWRRVRKPAPATARDVQTVLNLMESHWEAQRGADDLKRDIAALALDYQNVRALITPKPEPEVRWDEIACLLSVPDKPEFHDMYEGDPFRALIDLRRASSSDRFMLRLEIALPSAPRMDTALSEVDKAHVWAQTELYNVHLASPRPEGRITGGGLHIYVNSEPQNPTQLLFLETPAGPWRARLSMAQVGGRMAVVPYLIY